MLRATTRTGYTMTSFKFSTWRPNQGTRSRATFQLFATRRNDLFPQYLRSWAFEWWGSTWVWKKGQPMKFECSLEVKACWWWFCCRSAKHFHKVLCVWICNGEFRHVRIFVTPCSFYILLQCDGKARCFCGIKMPVGWQNFIKNPNCPDCVGWSKEQCSSPQGIVVWPIEQALLLDRH